MFVLACFACVVTGPQPSKAEAVADPLIGGLSTAEQAMAEAEDKPYRQRVYRISELGGVRAGTVRSEDFEFKDGPTASSTARRMDGWRSK
ncbi:MAG: hypothetical protein FJ254_10405 [Phycisphaerae bacterium]|nr:hypothetical protein [Phycisphaerae bacterium]